jgi:DNA-binding IclR family transcriptional regulator
MVLRAPQPVPGTGTPEIPERIAPIERGLCILSAFREGDEWLGNREIADRTGIPKATVTRLTQTLTAEGLLNHSTRVRKYRLAPGVLALGFASTHSFDIAALARPQLQEFADDCGVFAAIGNRSALDMAVVEHCHSATTLMTLALRNGARFALESTPLGLALLCGVPESERNYLLERIRCRLDVDRRLTLRQRVAEAQQQVSQRGYCFSTGNWGSDLVVAAAPLLLPERPPFVVACAAPGASLSRARLVEFVGPRLAALVETLQRKEARRA